MEVHVDFSLFDQCRETLTTTRALHCLCSRQLSNIFTKEDDEQSYTCKDWRQYLQFLVAVDKETSRLIAECEIPKSEYIIIVCKKFHRELSILQEKLQAYVQCADEDSQYRYFTEKQFKCALQRFNPVCLVSNVYNAIVSGDLSTDSLLAEVEGSSISALEEWIDFVTLNCLRAYLFHKQNLTFPAAGTESKEMVDHIKKILDKLRDIGEESRKCFFMQKKTLTPIMLSQSELMYLVDGFFKESSTEPMDRNAVLAEQFGTQLEKLFPAYSWGIVIAEDGSKLRNYLIYSSDHEPELLVQESIHPPFLSSQKPRHHTYTNGNEFGAITCGRNVTIAQRTLRQRRVTVFWRKPDGHAPIDWNARKMMEKVDIRKMALRRNRIKERSEVDKMELDQLEEALFASDSDYVLCLGLRHKREDDTLGVYVTRAGWPHHVQNETGHLFLWLSPYNGATQRYREKRLSRGALAGLTKATVRITHAVVQE